MWFCNDYLEAYENIKSDFNSSVELKCSNYELIQMIYPILYSYIFKKIFNNYFFFLMPDSLT